MWRALKGGTSNFGIVTRYDLAAFEQGGIWAGNIGNHISSLDQVLEAFANIAGAAEYDEYASIETAIEFTGSEWTIINEVAYTKEVNNTPAVFQPLVAIEPQTLNTLKNTNLSTLANETTTISTT